MGDSQIGVLKEQGRRLKSFNLDTYKYHALGDYAKTIRRLGTTDSFSTQPVSHCTATAYPILTCCFPYRASLNIVGPRLGSNALTANYSLNSWLALSAEKLAFVVLEHDIARQARSKNTCQIHHKNTIT
jgi:hypothetical protein